MSILLPILWINGRATNLLQRQVSPKSGNVYFAKSPKSSRFGDRVPASAVPDGLNTKFSIGTIDNEGIRVPLVPTDDGKAVIGQIEVVVDGKNMLCYVSLRDKGDGFNLVARVTNKKQAKVLTEDEIFTVVG